MLCGPTQLGYNIKLFISGKHILRYTNVSSAENWICLIYRANSKAFNQFAYQQIA